MKLEYADPSKNNWFLVSWTLSNKCNYRCSYCADHLHSGYTGQPRWETVKRFVENFKVNKDICYRLSGGEPTYWKHFIDLAKLVKEQNHVFSFLTNASQSAEYYKTISQHSDGIMISYHNEYADKYHIAEVVNAIECQVVVQVMLSPENFDEMFKVADYLHTTTNVCVIPKVIVEKKNGITNNVSQYTSMQKDIIKEWPFYSSVDDSKMHRGDILLDSIKVTGDQLIINELNNFYGWQCWGGIDMINIDMWGNMYRADCQVGGPIGNIERYKLPNKPITCNKNTCSCLSDLYLRKENEG